MKIEECRLIEPFICEETDSVVTVAQKLRAITLRHIFVVRENYPVGIISVMDINNRVVAENKDLATVARDIMSHPIDVFTVNDDVDSVASSMINKGQAMNAVVKDGSMIGIITLHELLRLKNEED
ncbi:MAG: cyclic nucleotide-binding/CBS domain-containing protein [Candidatus Woesearchaeota archaeon]